MKDLCTHKTPSTTNHMALGIALGVALGICFHNLALGIALGVVWGAYQQGRARREPKP